MNSDDSILDPTECVTATMVAFANTKALAMKVAGAAWNLWGTDSTMVRAALNLQRVDLEKAADEMAATLAGLGIEVPASPARIAAIATVGEFAGGYRDRNVLRTLRDDHRIAARDLREALEDCADDMRTSRILAQRAAAHDVAARQLDQLLCLCGSQAALAV